MVLGYYIYWEGAAPHRDNGHVYLLGGQGHGVGTYIHAVRGADHHPIPGRKVLRDKCPRILLCITVPVLPGQKERFRVAAGATGLVDGVHLRPAYGPVSYTHLRAHET